MLSKVLIFSLEEWKCQKQPWKWSLLSTARALFLLQIKYLELNNSKLEIFLKLLSPWKLQLMLFKNHMQTASLVY